jgi:hypothetical protein
MHSILSKARIKQQENKRSDRERKKTRSVARRRARCNWWHPAVIIPIIVRRRGVTQRGVRRGAVKRGAMRRGMGKKMVMILELGKTRRQN